MQLSTTVDRVLPKAHIYLTLNTKHIKPGVLTVKSTQKQLIHSKKMASLEGDIAEATHEVQKQLTFVSDFSDICIELLKERLPGLPEGNKDANLLATLFLQNQKTIATGQIKVKGIVKSMVQNVRTSIGHKSLTQRNTLANEYFRLAYHGLRAMAKSLNLKIRSYPDTFLPEINVIPQATDPVLLNIITRSVHAVVEKKQFSSEPYISSQLVVSLIQYLIKIRTLFWQPAM